MIEFAKHLADFAATNGRKHIIVLSSLDSGRSQKVDVSRCIKANFSQIRILMLFCCSEVCVANKFWLVSIARKYTTYPVALMMEKMMIVKNLGGRDSQSTIQLKDNGSISVLQLREREILHQERVHSLKMKSQMKIIAQVCLLLHCSHVARYLL